MSKKPAEKKSPLKTRPLRDPGQGLGVRLSDLVYGKMLMWWVVGILGIVLAAQEWLRWWQNSPSQPLIASAVAVVLVGLAAWQTVRIRREARRVGLGYQGERVVGQSLEQLRQDGYQVFHDVPGDGYNVDHVLVGPGGVFAIETKTWMKRRGPDAIVVFDGKTVTANGHVPDRDPIVQARAAAASVRRIIKQSTGLETQVRPVVLFPGWYTRHQPGADVWVLNETAFPKWVRREKEILSSAAVQQIGAGIAMHVRNSGQTQG